ncbi:hypothetical protein Tco_0094664, partial [Tanacetum coccineum]
LALIPFPRADDFIRGESNNKECPTRFKRESSRTNKESEKAKLDGTLDYILYVSYLPSCLDLTFCIYAYLITACNGIGVRMVLAENLTNQRKRKHLLVVRAQTEGAPATL